MILVLSVASKVTCRFGLLVTLDGQFSKLWSLFREYYIGDLKGDPRSENYPYSGVVITAYGKAVSLRESWLVLGSYCKTFGFRSLASKPQTTTISDLGFGVL